MAYIDRAPNLGAGCFDEQRERRIAPIRGPHERRCAGAMFVCGKAA
jgi:hypothetical protein